MESFDALSLELCEGGRDTEPRAELSGTCRRTTLIGGGQSAHKVRDLIVPISEDFESALYLVMTAPQFSHAGISGAEDGRSADTV